jgi:hypothetical protein
MTPKLQVDRLPYGTYNKRETLQQSSGSINARRTPLAIVLEGIMAEPAGQVIAITGQDGNRVNFSVPLVGFPDGFQLNVGDQVFLVAGENGPEAWPMARAREVSQVPEQRGQVLAAAEDHFALQEATVFAEAQDDRHIVFTIPNARGRLETVLSVRSPSGNK